MLSGHMLNFANCSMLSAAQGGKQMSDEQQIGSQEYYDSQEQMASPQQPGTRPARANSHEFLKFAVLVIIFVVVIAAIALLRPLIFGQIVPAVLGNDQETAITQPPGQEVSPPASDLPTATPAAGVVETPLPPMVTPSPGPQVVPALTATITRHVVQPGETLYQIANLYSVSVAALAAANNIVNPNLLMVGTVLIIPR
jgi:LysM repeat protein